MLRRTLLGAMGAAMARTAGDPGAAARVTGRMPAAGLPSPRPDQAYRPVARPGPVGGAAGVLRARQVIIVGANGGLFVYSPAAGPGTLVASVAGTAGTDPYGNAYLAGETSYGSIGPQFLAAQLNAGGLTFLTATSQAGPYQTEALIAPSLNGIQYLFPHSAGRFVIPPSGDLTGASDTSNINTALANGAAVELVQGSYHTLGLTLVTGANLTGPGGGSAVIHHIGGLAGITGTDVASVTLKGFDLIGPSSGGANGIDLIKSAASNIPFTHIEDVRVSHFGGDGVSIKTPIASALKNVNSFLNTGNGFTISDPSACTSTNFENCYANANGAYGYSLTNLQYSALTGCACDNNLNGYLLSGCHGVVLHGCGAEKTTTDSVIITGSKACSVLGAAVFNNANLGIHVTGASQRITVGGAEEISPAGGAVNFLKTDAGTTTVAWGIVHLTADLLGGTVTNLDGSA